MIYFITLFILYIFSEKVIVINEKDSELTKKTKNILKIFFIMFCILNMYGFCVSNVIYSCLILYIISYIKDDEIKDFLDSFRFDIKENFTSDYINKTKSFSRLAAADRKGNMNILKYKINNSNYFNDNSIQSTDQTIKRQEGQEEQEGEGQEEKKQISSDYSKEDLKRIKEILERKFWVLKDNETYDMYEIKKILENKNKKENLELEKGLYNSLVFYTNKLFSLIGL